MVRMWVYIRGNVAVFLERWLTLQNSLLHFRQCNTTRVYIAWLPTLVSLYYSDSRCFPVLDTCVNNDASQDADERSCEVFLYANACSSRSTYKKREKKCAYPYFKVKIWIAMREKKNMQVRFCWEKSVHNENDKKRIRTNIFRISHLF